MADATHYIPVAPVRSPRRGGIRSVAEFRAGSNRLALGGELEYTSPGCGIAVGAVELCYPSPADPQAEKTSDGIETLGGIGPVFGVYAGVECWLGGSDFEADAIRLLDQGADRAVEDALNTWIQTATPEAHTTFTGALGAADNIADSAYPGLPVIALNRGDAVAAYAERALLADDAGNLWTPNGTPVLSSSQIDSGTVAVLGAITVIEGERKSFLTQQYELNREYAIAEQVFGILVDCGYIEKFTVGPVNG